jgi:hypothetical protein
MVQVAPEARVVPQLAPLDGPAQPVVTEYSVEFVVTETEIELMAAIVLLVRVAVCVAAEAFSSVEGNVNPGADSVCPTKAEGRNQKAESSTAKTQTRKPKFLIRIVFPPFYFDF